MGDKDKDTFIPAESTELKKEETLPKEHEEKNLAADEKLAEKLLPHIQYFYDKYKSDRSELEDIWEVADWMWKCGQNESIRETERIRQDRNAGDDRSEYATKTKTQKVGSTLFWRQVRSRAAQLVAILNSRTDPFRYRSRWNEEIFESPEQADELANQHNLLMRWTRDADDFKIKSIELMYQLFKYGNIPIYMYWKEKYKEILDRWKPGEKPSRKRLCVDCRPSCDWIQNEMFYADQNIGNIQDQQMILVKRRTNISKIRDLVRGGDYDADQVKTIGRGQIYKGGDREFGETKEENAGYASTTGDTETGEIIEFNVHAMLPIDESKPKGKRWDEDKHELKKYWITVETSLDPKSGICVRIERNPDPDDEYPFEMLSIIPDDNDKLYNLSLAQILRGNYTESTTKKQQALDVGTLNNNRPVKMLRGNVRMQDGTDDFTYGKDKVYLCEDDINKDIGFADSMNVPDNLSLLQYLDTDSDEAAGNTKIVRGEFAGSRTSANEAERAYDAGTRPGLMTAEYVFNKYLGFYARKGVRLWHIYARNDQILQVSDSDRLVSVRPADMFGDFHVELDVVDEFEQNIADKQNFTFAAQNMIPLFAQFLDMRNMAKDAFQRVLKWDVTRYIKPDNSDATRVRARIMINQMMNYGTFAPPSPNDDFDVLITELKGERVQYLGVEDEYPNVVLLDKAIAMAEEMKATQPQILPNGSPEGAPQVDTAGEAAGEQIAGRAGEIAEATS